MNKTELLHILEETVPPLKEKLHVERVLYRKADNKAYFSLLSDVLVPEVDFLALERRLRGLFPKMQIALRVASPGLAEAFISDIGQYTQVLKDFLRRQSPALRTWLDDVGWSVDEGRILLTCPDDFAISFFRRNGLDEKLSRAVWDIFRLKMPVALVKCGEREAWVEKMRAETARRREQEQAENRAGNPHTAALTDSQSQHGGPAPDNDPAPWEDAPASAVAITADAPHKTMQERPRRADEPAAPRKSTSKGPVLKGRAIADPPVPIVELAEDSGVVVVEGDIIGVNEPKELKGGETVLVTFSVGDDTSTIYCKAFYNYRMKRAGFGETPAPPTEEEKAFMSLALDAWRASNAAGRRALRKQMEAIAQDS